MLNPFFIQGNYTEQNLVQDIINEQLKMYGIEVYYMPRQIFAEGKILRDVMYSKFQNAFPIEAYLVNYEGFESNSVLMSKFGVKVSDEMTLIISKERFELYIGELMRSIPKLKNSLRPNEGDLLYIPLSDSLMEIKYVENRKPFFQLQKTYTYELKCEVYELEDDLIQTGIGEIDRSYKNLQYTCKLTLSGIGITATAITQLVETPIQYIEVINGGYGYAQTPTIIISDPLEDGVKATAVGIMTNSLGLNSSYSVKEIYLQNPGSKYDSKQPFNIQFFGGSGYNTSVRVGISTQPGIGPITILTQGQGYTSEPTVTFSSPISGGTTATGRAILNSLGKVSSVWISNGGIGYTVAPTITIGPGSQVSQGNFIFEEEVIGSISGAVGSVRDWNSDNNKLELVGFGTNFLVGDLIIGSKSQAQYIVSEYRTYSSGTSDISYAENDTIQEEADSIIDFTELNPFGEI
jgi:hypothetical protein